MSAFVYANGQYHCLAGNKIVKDAALLDMKATDKIIVNGQAYKLGGTYNLYRLDATGTSNHDLVMGNIDPKKTMLFQDSVYGGSLVNGVIGFLNPLESDVFLPYNFTGNNLFEKFSGFMSISNTLYGFALRAGKLYKIAAEFSSTDFSQKDAICEMVGEYSDWTDISYSVRFGYSSDNIIAGIRQNKLYKINISGATLVDDTQTWVNCIPQQNCVVNSEGKLYSANGTEIGQGMYPWTWITGTDAREGGGPNSGTHAWYDYGICDGKLYRFAADDTFSMIDQQTGEWTNISQRYFLNNNPGQSPQIPLGICDGKLYYVQMSKATLIDDSGVYTDCSGYFIFSQDDTGVAIRNGVPIILNSSIEPVEISLSGIAQKVFAIDHEAIYCIALEY